MGGLSKKAFQINGIIKRNRQPYLVLDAGGLLFKRAATSPGRQDQEKITASGIVEAYNLMQVDAVGIADNDLAGGLSFLLSQKKQAKFSWLSANLVNKSNHSPLFTPSITRQVGKAKVGIIGITGSRQTGWSSSKNEAILLGWQEVMPDLLAKLKKSCDMIILLSSLSPQENTKLANTYQAVNLILQSGGRPSNKPPTLIGNALVCQTISQGKYLGWLRISWQDSQKWLDKSSPSQKILIKKRELDRLNYQLQRHQNNKQLLNRKNLLITQLNQLETATYASRSGKRSESTYKNQFIPINASLPDQPEVIKAVRNINMKINELGRQAAQGNNAHLTIKQAAGNAKPPNYAGWPACVKCHKGKSPIWQKTHHARSYLTLSKKNQQYNRECIACHVTGIFNGSEPHALSLYSGLRQVGCEACHGPGLNHTNMPQKYRMTAIPPEKTCRRCHTDKRDRSFNYEKDIKKLGCGSAS